MKEEIKKKRNFKKWKLIPILLIGVLFISIVSAGWWEDLFGGNEPSSNFVIIGNNFKKTCSLEACNLVLYSGTRYVYEDKEWKYVENAKELSNKGKFKVKYLEKDPSFDLSVNNFNSTYVNLTMNFVGNPEDYPEFCQVTDINNSKCDFKLDEKWEDIDPETGEVIENNQLKFQYKWEMKDGIVTKGDKIKYEFKGDTFSRKFKFGGNSTTIVLQDAGTENLDDAYLEQGNPDSTGDSSTLYAINRTADNRNIIIKFDISQIPSDGTIEEADLILTVASNSMDGGDDFTSASHHVYSSFNWLEEDITWNTGPNVTTNYNATATDENPLGQANGVNSRVYWNITEMVNSEASNNLSILLLSNNQTGSPSSLDYVRFDSKEGSTAGDRPILNITYDLFESNFTYLFNGVSNTVYTQIDGTSDGINFDEVNLFFQLNQGNSSGNFTSDVFDLSSNSSFGNISWVQSVPYQKELPNNQEDELQSTLGGANMTGNVLLLHMEDNVFSRSFLDNKKVGWVDMSGNILLAHLDGNGEDSSGEGNDFTAVGGTTFNQDGKLGRAATFDGVDNTATSNFGVQDYPFSVSAWIYRNETGQQGIFSNKWHYQGITATQHGGWAWFTQADNTFRVIGGNISSCGGGGSCVSSISINTNEWAHIVLTANSSGDLTYYINGVQENETTSRLMNIQDSGDGRKTALGVRNSAESTYDSYLNGSLDEVSVWNRELSYSEVLDIYGNQSLQFNISDTSGNNNNGTIQGGTNCSASSKIGTYSCSLDGHSDWVDLPVNNNLGDTFTVSSWVYPTSSSSEIAIASQGSLSSDGYRLTLYRNSTVDIYFRIKNDSGTLFQSYVDKDIALNTWHHIVSSYNGTDIIVYHNGNQETYVSANGIMYDSADYHFIGAYYTVLNDFNGSVDEFAVWNRSLLASEIEDLYLRGALELNLSVRSCDDAACSGETWNGTYIDSNSTDISDLVSNQYFQYKMDFSTENVDFSPEVYNFTMSYTEVQAPDTCTYGGSGTWTVSCSDNCVISTQYTVDGNLSLNGAGNFTLKENLTFSDSSNEQFIFNNGCTFVNDAFVNKHT